MLTEYTIFLSGEDTSTITRWMNEEEAKLLQGVAEELGKKRRSIYSPRLLVFRKDRGEQRNEKRQG